MAMGRESDRQGDLMVTWAEMPRSPGHVFYDRLQAVLIAGGFDGFVETVCQPYYAPKMGAPSVPPGRYFRVHMVGYFEGICSERGIALALFGFDVAARFSAAGEPGEGSRSLVVVEDARAAPARDPRDGLRLGVEAGGRARSGQGQADWHRRVDDGGQCRAAHDRAPGRWPDLSRNADADSQGERHRDAKCGRSRPYRPHPQG